MICLFVWLFFWDDVFDAEVRKNENEEKDEAKEKKRRVRCFAFASKLFFSLAFRTTTAPPE